MLKVQNKISILFFSNKRSEITNQLNLRGLIANILKVSRIEVRPNKCNSDIGKNGNSVAIN